MMAVMMTEMESADGRKGWEERTGDRDGTVGRGREEHCGFFKRNLIVLTSALWNLCS